MTRTRWTLAGMAAAVAILSGATAHADRIKLRGGGEIKGVVVPDPAKPETVFVQTEASAKPLTFPKTSILSVVRQAGPLDDFMARRDGIEPTAQAQYDFGLWCEESKLTGPAEIMYHMALTIDPNFGPAHKKLGHVLHGDRWLTYDEQREAQGLVKLKGKWTSKAEKDKIDAAAATSAEQSSWASRIKLLRRKLNDPDQAIRESAESQISAIRDPAAVPGLMRAFAADGDAVRIRLAQLLAAIPGPESTDALVNLLVTEQNPEVRQSMLDELVRRRDPESATRLIAVLKAQDPDVIARAAWALAMMKHTAAVPRLVDALFQTEKRMVLIPVANPGGGGISGSFGFAQNTSSSISGFPGNAAVGSVAGGTAVSGGGVVSGGGGNYGGGASAPGFATIASQPVITGVAMAPGVVAYGAGSVPYPVGSNPVQMADNSSYREVPAKVNVKHPNIGVLKALQTLTGENFGFDQPAWKKWIGTSFKIETDAPRRVPKP